MHRACGRRPAAVEVLVADPVADTMKSYLGAWGETCPDGSAGVTTNDSDGTYAIAMADGMTSTGTWTFGDEQSCGTEEGAEQGNC